MSPGHTASPLTGRHLMLSTTYWKARGLPSYNTVDTKVYGALMHCSPFVHFHHIDSYERKKMIPAVEVWVKQILDGETTEVLRVWAIFRRPILLIHRLVAFRVVCTLDYASIPTLFRRSDTTDGYRPTSLNGPVEHCRCYQYWP